VTPSLAPQHPIGAIHEPPITHRTLHDEATIRVRDMIIEGRLQPGARINETQLGQTLGVSRTPLREALRTLASEGLLDLVPRRGAVVRTLSLGEVAEILEVTKALEQMAGRLACERGTAQDIAAVRRLHDEMMTHYARRERLAYYKLNHSIHAGIVRMAGNATLSEFHATLQARSKQVRYVGNSAPDKWAGAVSDHEEIIAALEQRDAERLAAILGAHMDNTLIRVRDLF
jgi:DNA-binding GntR family transcriptional regulator